MLLLIACNASPLELAWEEGLTTTDPALIADEGLIITVSDSTMRGIDAASGGTLWSAEVPEGAGGSPVVSDDDVILLWSEIGVFGFDLEGEIVYSRNAEMFVEADVALTADGDILVVGENLDKDSAVLTTMTLDAGVVSQVEFATGRPVTQPAIDAAGNIYVVVWGTDGLYTLYALDSEGAERWHVFLKQGLDHDTEVIPFNGLWVVGNGILQELDPASGVVLDDDEGAYVSFDSAGSVVRSEAQLEIEDRDDVPLEFPNLACGHTAVDTAGYVYAACALPNDPGRTVVIGKRNKVLIGDVAEWASETQLASPMLWEDLVIYRLDAGLIAYSGAGPLDEDAWSRSRGGLRNHNRAP